jgi:hypothetical protein
MTTAVARLRSADPARWRAVAVAWRTCAERAGRWSAEFAVAAARLAAAWSGAAATAAAARLTALRRAVDLFRLRCWAIDQIISEFAAALTRAAALLPSREPAALALAETADTSAGSRLGELHPAASPPPPATLPSCAATPGEIRVWWDSLSRPQQRWLLVTDPRWLAPLDGIPISARDMANRLLLDDYLFRRPAGARPAGLDRLADRLAAGDGPRAYLLRLDTAGDGRVVVALGDPDRAANVLTQVPGMTADLRSYLGELERAERVAVRAGELAPAAATSTVTWLDYDAPDFVDEAASARPAAAAVPELRRFQDGLRATHEGAPAHQTVLGHSYGSLVVGAAARTAGLAADGVVFVGSPGVGVDTAADLRVPPDHVWSTTSRSDVIQYAAVSPKSVLGDLAVTAAAPAGVGALLAFGLPERDLWFGHNPSDPAFGARVFPSQPDGGHLGYWDRGDRALDGITAITVGRTP